MARNGFERIETGQLIDTDACRSSRTHAAKAHKRMSRVLDL
jgi:hypothetical protein